MSDKEQIEPEISTLVKEGVREVFDETRCFGAYACLALFPFFARVHPPTDQADEAIRSRTSSLTVNYQKLPSSFNRAVQRISRDSRDSK